jgi:hypothetical protein
MLPRHAQRKHAWGIARRLGCIQMAVNREKANACVKLGNDDAMIVKLLGKCTRNAGNGRVSNDRRR